MMVLGSQTGTKLMYTRKEELLDQLATWNVGTLYQTQKLENVKQEMNKLLF